MLKTVRLTRGLSQSQLANRCDMPVQTLQKYENNFANINGARLETLLKLSINLDCRIEDIVTDDSLKDLLYIYESR